MPPFFEKETRRVLPRGKTRLPEGVTFIQPEDTPDDEARVLIERYRGENLSGGGSMTIPEPLTVDIVGREEENIFIAPRDGKPVVLTYEPPIEVQAERIIDKMWPERYFPRTKKLGIYAKRNMENVNIWKQAAIAGILGWPFVGTILFDFLSRLPRRVVDFATDYWQKERAKITMELREKEGLTSGR